MARRIGPGVEGQGAPDGGERQMRLNDTEVHGLGEELVGE